MDASLSTAPDIDIAGLVEDPAEAARLLVRLRRLRNLVTLRAATSQREFSSMLLSLDLQHRYLVLDAPRPRPPEGLFIGGTRVYARTQLDGAALVFTAHIDSIITRDSEGEAADGSLMMEWPGRVSYYQRRRDYRVSVPATLMHTPARLVVDGKAREARLVDLSTSGAAILLTGDTAGLHEEECVDCVLPLPERDLRAPLRVRNLTRTRDGVRIGGTLQIDGSSEFELLQRTVTTIERWWLQKHP
ncbi:flagellar brake protein [Algiphilus sp.]|uniref:flagellar brake protein n=1 Tax=Algiphilus sp. TaxID=1872431 RepID=UPI003C47E0C8